MKKLQALLLATTMYAPLPALAQTVPPAASQLPVGAQVVTGQASISQSGAQMNINQTTDRAAINWQSFDIGSAASVNFNQPSSSSVALNRVMNGNPTQIFGRLSSNGQVFITNASGVYFAPGASANVGGLVATTHTISDDDFMAKRDHFDRNGATGAVVNEGTLTAGLGGYIALLAPEVRNKGVVVAQMGTVAMAAGETYELQFDGQKGLADITVTKASIAALVENKQAVRAPGGLVIMSAQAANHLQGGVVKNSGSIEAGGLVEKGGVVRLVASDSIELAGSVNADAATSGKGGKVTAVASLDNPDSTMIFSGTISARGGSTGGDVETSASHVSITDSARVDTTAAAGKTGNWLIDPYDYTIDGSAAAAIGTSLNTSNVQVTTAADNAGQGSNGNNASTGNIQVTSAISSASANALTLTAANAIDISAAISTGALTLTGPGGITLNNDLTTLTAMTLNGNVTLGGDVTLTSGVSNTYTSYTSYVVPAGITSLTATLVGGAGGRGGNDTSTGGVAGTVGTLTGSFAVTGGQTIYLAPGSGGAQGGDQATNAGGGAGGTNQFSLASGGTGGKTGPSGNSGGGGGGGGATILSLTNTPTTGSALLIAGGGGGGGGSGNNTACPSLCGDQSGANYRTDGSFDGQTGPHSGNQANPIDDGGGSGGGGGGLAGGNANASIFFVNEWTGRGGNSGSSGAANGFTTTSLGTSVLTTGNSQNGYATISYGGGTVGINGTVNGAHALNIVARSSDVNITGIVGDSTALASLNIVGSQGIALGGGAVTTTGAQTYTGPLTLNSSSNSFTTTSNGNVTFAGNIIKGTGVNGNVMVSTGSGNVAMNGQTGGSAAPIGAVTISSTGNTTLAGAVYAASLAKTGSGKTTVSGGLVQTTGAQSYTGILDLGGNTTLSSTGTGDITLSGAVSNSTQSNLTINAADGSVTLAGNLAVGTNARPTPIGDVSITASGTVTLGSSGTPISADAKSLSVTANAANTYADTGTSFTCNTGASATGVCLGTSALFNVATASSFSGPLTGTASLAKDGAGKLTLTGTNTYSGNTTVPAGILEIGGSGTLGSGNYAGNINTTGQLRFNTSANQTLSGTMSGTGFINTRGAGTTQITTLANADHYNLLNAYVVPTSSTSGSSSLYGSTPTFSYQVATTAAGGTAFTDSAPTGTAVITGAPTLTSSVGNYTVNYISGITLGNERYLVQAGNALNWSVVARPLTVTVNKIYDNSALFSSGFTLSGTVNGDALPTLTGTASTASSNAASYSSFASSTLSQNDTNYTLTGATINASISAKPLDLTVGKTFDGSAAFNAGFILGGMIGAQPMPGVSGTASTSSSTAGTYTQFASNNLVLSDANYTLTGGTVSATIAPMPPVVPVPTPPAVITTPTANPADTVLPNYTNSTANTSAPVATQASSETATAATAANIAAPAPAASTTTTASGIVVSLVQEPSAQTSGMVSVLIPKDMTAKSGGFAFPLPEQASVKVETGASAFTMKTSSGDALPGWIQFNPETKIFTATDVPAGGLPLHIVISNGETQTTIVIAENQ